MVLQDRFIIVDQRQLRLGVDQELVGHPGMVHVVDAAGQDGRQDLVGGEDFIQGGAAEEDVGGLGDISSVQVVVVGNILNKIIFVNINISWATLLSRQVQNIFEVSGLTSIVILIPRIFHITTTSTRLT